MSRSFDIILIWMNKIYDYPNLSFQKDRYRMTVKTNSPREYALVTGGSNGLGRSISHQLAVRGYGIILVAFDDSQLFETAADISAKTGVDVKVIGTDLNLPGSCEEIASQVKAFQINLVILVNNVGLGDVSFFHANTVSFNQKIVRLNCSVMVELTQLLLPELKKSKNPYILNISSLAGLFPVPYKAVYSASKHFVKAFSFSLREELASDNVTVTVVFPGSILTNPDVIRRVNSFGRLARICSYKPDEIADLSVRSLFRKKREVYPGLINRIYILIRYIIGYRITMNLVKKRMHKEALWDLNNKIEIKVK